MAISNEFCFQCTEDEDHFVIIVSEKQPEEVRCGICNDMGKIVEMEFRWVHA